MKQLLYGFVLAVGFLVACGSPVRGGDDWEYWSSFEVSGAIDTGLNFKVKLEPRYNDNCGDHYYTAIDIGLEWKIRDWLVLSPHYLHVDEKKKGDWKVEDRPSLDAVLKWKLVGLSFSDRNRLEYRIKEDKNYFRYSNKLTLKFPTLTGLKIRGCLAEEPFYDFDVGALNKNRLYVGVDFKIVEHIGAGVYYIFESRKKNSEWTNVNIIRTTLKYNF